jgi:hypothetical protein
VGDGGGGGGGGGGIDWMMSLFFLHAFTVTPTF